MKFLIYLTIAFTICASTFSYESEGVLDDPDHPGKCVYGGLVLSAGEEGKVPNRCERVLCGSNSYAKVQGCGDIGVEEGCELGDYIDVNAPYGECCDRKIICKRVL